RKLKGECRVAVAKLGAGGRVGNGDGAVDGFPLLDGVWSRPKFIPSRPAHFCPNLDLQIDPFAISFSGNM
ncbi:hypothetical protein P879_03360, partial [Paragonimus westermani]